MEDEDWDFPSCGKNIRTVELITKKSQCCDKWCLDGVTEPDKPSILRVIQRNMYDSAYDTDT